MRGLVLSVGLMGMSAATPATAATLSRPLQAVLALDPGRPQAVWVFLKDKGPAADAAFAEARSSVTPRALSRRRLRGSEPAVIGFDDLRVAPGYVEEIALRVSRIRHVSRWFNAVSAEATPEQIAAVAELPFIAGLDLVRRFRHGPSEPFTPISSAAAASTADRRQSPWGIDYGSSAGQLAQINVPAVHQMELHGEGALIAVLDAGFNNLSHEAFSSTSILARHDFVNGDDDVGDGSDHGNGDHGTETLSVLGGYKEGELVGPAFRASFILAKTENTDSETPVEEDNWAAAAEWAEGLGADVISSSLGYLTFDAPYASYTWADMNGETAITTRAAELAAARGVVVVNSAGNEGYDPDHNTLSAPADGKRVLAAGGLLASGERVAFSSVGPSADGRIKPDMAAQAFRVTAAAPVGTSLYGQVSGTSFSCPLIAGVTALVLQAHPTYTVDQVLTVMRGTASRAAAPDNLLGYGIVNALAAVTAQQP